MWVGVPYEGLIGFSFMTAFRSYHVRGDSVRWRCSGGPVRRALGCGLVLAVARNGHGPTAARLALQIETQNGIILILFARHAGAVRAVGRH